MAFVLLKSYDGGKRWEQGPEYSDFASAANAALILGAKDTSIRYRVDLKRVQLRRAGRKAARSKRRHR